MDVPAEHERFIETPLGLELIRPRALGQQATASSEGGRKVSQPFVLGGSGGESLSALPGPAPSPPGRTPLPLQTSYVSGLLGSRLPTHLVPGASRSLGTSQTAVTRMGQHRERREPGAPGPRSLP